MIFPTALLNQDKVQAEVYKDFTKPLDFGLTLMGRVVPNFGMNYIC
ncbi:hypothetical protein NIES3974_17860 [Calothrix sp. NIES-3974]|nr:hypothetical protein NIES3974_17860 [Calothrix sp. NIES-3974]